MIWEENSLRAGRLPQRNIMNLRTRSNENKTTVSSKDAFNLFITKDIIEEICICANREGKGIRNKNWREIDPEEITAFIGLLMFAGVEKNWDVSIRELWSEEQRPFYRACINRFDDKRTRNTRLETDRLAAITFIWQEFLKNCKKLFIAGECVTIDEQLVPFRGKCAFCNIFPVNHQSME